MTAGSSRNTARDGVRADARRNRERLLAAAREVFAEHGLDAPMATVARRAGVGVATLYRHFPTRDALVRGAFARQMETCGRALRDALAADDPWTGLTHLVETVCALQREERGFPAAFLDAFPQAGAQHARSREQAERDLTVLVRRAQASGALRPDFHPSDLVVALVAHCGLVAALPDDPKASRRLVAYLLRSFRGTPATDPLPPPTTLTLRGFPATPESGSRASRRA
ncbi:MULTISPECIES: TetR family transcriptional regulator [unclassified Streptomyces]|uniref:TetR family transcriptional regulator n=1 Tax=unclassified Streptomyces TaxID=2593676 RepID=UPI00039E2733|nr:TetR/AcrR family transcriptional regulator [Streptomyces sp. McG7]MBT2906645.1 TetR/AcrR family transcriptional regulator [Streptomyces sp. McG8]MXQ57517.1 TetR family transcriptional regulator [Streptomyces sp. XHT-2]MYQ29519.1 TetR family transcriptional regulator [Streptomyces sp. SID4956]MYW55020.1 TetR family transcriptional regulator [Streptomyces sp. SID8376]WSB49740.1 TetR/AcrR family transcriptional regulator [Streptomyces cellulosae]